MNERTRQMAAEQELAAKQGQQFGDSASLVELTAHHDGHGLNESIQIAAGPVGPGGARHVYRFGVRNEKSDVPAEVGWLQFQEGPRNVEGSTPGVTEAAILAVLIDRLRGFQAGPYACVENALILTQLEACLCWTRARADARAARGVLGTYQK